MNLELHLQLKIDIENKSISLTIHYLLLSTKK